MQNNQSILIVGNGPSSSYKAAGKLAKGCEVARTNWFFLEKEQIFGKQVDYLFHSVHALLINYIYFVLNADNDVYRIMNNVDVKFMLSSKNQLTKIDIHAPRKALLTSIFETTGLTILKFFLESGYQTIHITGIDFYQGKYAYLNTKNTKITKLCGKTIKDNMRAYDLHSLHNLEYDINYLSDLLTQYPDVKIIATSCHPETTKIWQQFKQVEVMELSSHQKPEIYDAYLDKQWLQKAVDDCAKKYGFKIKLFILYQNTAWFIKRKSPKIYVFLRYCRYKIARVSK